MKIRSAKAARAFALLSGLALSLCAASFPAEAETLTFDWSATAKGDSSLGYFPYTGSGTLTATVGASGDTVTNITGSFTTNTSGSPSTVAVTGLSSGSGDDLIFPIGTTFTSPSDYTSVANLDTNGLDFATTAGTILIFSFVTPSSSPTEATGNFYGESGGGFGVGLFNLTQTPVPATLPLLASGLGLLGYLAMQRKRSAKQAFAAA